MFRSSRDHYEELLARRYTWLDGGLAVDAVDLSPTLLQELQTHAAEHGVASIRPVEADLLAFLKDGAGEDPYSLVVCMGDTLPHLNSFDDVDSFIRLAAQRLAPGGRSVPGFRDLSGVLQGLDRFIPVRSDAERVFTCFLEHESDEHLQESGFRIEHDHTHRGFVSLVAALPGAS